MKAATQKGSLPAISLRERRTKRVLLERRLLAAFLLTAVASAAASTLAPSLSTWAFLAAGIMALTPLAGLICGADIEGEFAYSDTLPIRCLWDARAIGEFGASEVQRAWMERDRVTGIGVYTSVVIRSNRGETATFGGIPEAPAGLRKSIDNPELLAMYDAEMNLARGNLNKGLDWLREHGIAVEVATAESERRPKVRTARIVATVTAAVVGTGVGVGVWTFSQASPTPFWVLVSLGLYLASTVAASSWMFAFRVGSGVSEVALYSERLPLSCLWDGEALGAIKLEDIKSASLHEGTPTKASRGGPRLRVKPRRGRDAVFMRSVAPSDFDRALTWLDERGIAVEDGWHIRGKIASGER